MKFGYKFWYLDRKQSQVLSWYPSSVQKIVCQQKYMQCFNFFDTNIFLKSNMLRNHAPEMLFCQIEKFIDYVGHLLLKVHSFRI